MIQATFHRISLPSLNLLELRFLKPFEHFLGIFISKKLNKYKRQLLRQKK